jgi:hypothetical protein
MMHSLELHEIIKHTMLLYLQMDLDSMLSYAFEIGFGIMKQMI